MLFQRIVQAFTFLLLLSLLFGMGCRVVFQNQGGWITSFGLVNQSANLGVFQGYASDGATSDSVNYFFDTHALYLSSSPNRLNVVASNRDVLVPDTNHMGDGDVYDGKVFGVIEHWAGCRASTAPIYIVIFNGQTLARERYIEITADLPEASGIAINPDSNEAIVTSFCDPNNLYVYGMEDWRLRRKIPLSIPVPGIQGAAFRQGVLYIAQTKGALYGLRLEDNAMRFLFQASMHGEFEGLDFHTSQLRWLVNQAQNQHILYSYAPTQN
jgi:hypothetical protein